jgi:hypothetical protein
MKLEEEYNHLERPTPKGLKHNRYNMKKSKYKHHYLIVLHSTLCTCNKKHTYTNEEHMIKRKAQIKKTKSNMERFIYMERL